MDKRWGRFSKRKTLENRTFYLLIFPSFSIWNRGWLIIKNNEVTFCYIYIWRQYVQNLILENIYYRKRGKAFSMPSQWNFEIYTPYYYYCYFHYKTGVDYIPIVRFKRGKKCIQYPPFTSYAIYSSLSNDGCRTDELLGICLDRQRNKEDFLVERRFKSTRDSYICIYPYTCIVDIYALQFAVRGYINRFKRSVLNLNLY